MTLPFFHKPGIKKKKTNNLYPKLSSLVQKPMTGEDEPLKESLEPEEMDENFFYMHIMTHFHSLFCESSVVCIPHSKSIEGLVLTKDIIETHCFQPSPYFCGQYMATRQKQKIIALDYPIITTIMGFKEERTVHIMAEESVYLKNKKIKLLSIDRLLEGDPPKYHHHSKHNSITIPPVRNSRTDLEFLNMFSENLESLHELQSAVQEFTDSYVYIKGYNRFTVERIQHIYMKAYRTILQRNKLLQDSCRTPSEHDQFLELVENVVMSFLHKKIWIQTLQSLLASQDNYIDSICFAYSHATLSQYSVRYPISEMTQFCFEEAITTFKRVDSDLCHVEPYKSTSKQLAFTPLEKLAVIKSTLDLISSAVYNYVRSFGQGNSDTSVTADEMIPLLAFVIVQSNVPRIASLVYYIQHYRLARMVEGSVNSFVVTTMKSACEFLKDDPLSLHDTVSSPENFRTRSISFGSANKPNSAPPHINLTSSSSRYTNLHHRKSQSADLYNSFSDLHIHHNYSSYNIGMEDDVEEEDQFSTTTNNSSSMASSQDNSRRNSAILRPHIVLPNPRHNENRKSLDIPNDWLLPDNVNNNINSSTSYNRYKAPTRHLIFSRPMISTTFPSISSSTPLPVEGILPTDMTTTLNNDDSATDIPKLGRSLSASTVVRKRLSQQPPRVINIRDRISFDGIQRPASICLDTRSLHSIEDSKEDSEELMGDFLIGLSKLDGDVVGGRTGSFKTYRRH